MKALIFLIVVAALAVAAFFLPLADWLAGLSNWVAENGVLAWVVFVLSYIVATVLMLPGSLLTLVAGFLFGLGLGYALVAVGSVVGASLAFLIGRFFARAWVDNKLATMPRFRALDAAVAERGALIVFLTRLSPLFPFNLLNYGLGVTRISFGSYVLASWIGMIPGTILYVYLGSVAQDLSSLLAGELPESSASTWLLYAGLAATLALTIYITRFATRILNARLDAADVPG